MQKQKSTATVVDWALIRWPKERWQMQNREQETNPMLYSEYGVILFGKARNDSRHNLTTTEFEDGHRLMTSPVVGINGRKIATQNTIYEVEIADVHPDYARWCKGNQQDLLPEDFDTIQSISFELRLTHHCEVCGKEELLTPEEAHNRGWDYPPRMGRFRQLGPRTCGGCSMVGTLFMELAMKKTSLSQLSEHRKQTLERIRREPGSIIPRTL